MVFIAPVIIMNTSAKTTHPVHPVEGTWDSSVAILTSRSVSGDRGSSASIGIERLVGASKQAFSAGRITQIRVTDAG
jgi:hypothetical protein